MSDPATPPSPGSSDEDVNQASAAQSATWAARCAVAAEEAAALARRFAEDASNAMSGALAVSTDAGNVLVDGTDSKPLLRVDPRPENLLSANAEGLYADGSFTQDGEGAVQRTIQDKAREWISPEDYGAIGNGLVLDDDAIALTVARACGRPIKTRDDAVYLMSQTVTVEGGRFIFKGKGTFRRADGVIVNTDDDHSHFTPLFRLQGMTWVDLGECTFDDNRQGQVYPATQSRPGRGSNPFRHNGTVEICPDSTGTFPSANVHIRKAAFDNAYLNGLVLWQVRDAWIGENSFRNTTWNGIAGAGLRNVCFYRNDGYRCGDSSMFGSLQQMGDRSLIQVREFPRNFTTESEGIPCMTTGEYPSGGINRFVDFTGNRGDECGVETIFGRAIMGLSGGENHSHNVGYGRNPAAGFHPAHIWFESCEGHNRGNIGFQDTVRPGDDQPDGMVAYAMTGDASALYPFVGNYTLDVRGARMTSAKDTTGNPVPGLLYRGLRISSNVNADFAFIDGTDNDGIYGTNFDSFELSPVCIHDSSANSSTIINTNLNQDISVAGGPIELLRYGSNTGGVPTNIFALNCTVDAGKSVIVYNGNLNNVAFPPVNVQFSDSVGNVNATSDMTFHSQDAAFYRQVKNTYIGANAVAGFQTQSNGGNQLLMGTTSSLYAGSLGVALSGFVHASGANTGGLFVTATGGPVVMRPGGARAMTLFASGRIRIGASATDDGTNALQLEGPIGLRSYTVATLPTAPAGIPVAYASDGRKQGQPAGSGTGVPVYYSAGQWRVFSGDSQVQT
ncbi:hypothetical protein HDG34_003362 [Paraburkholderia sp. HC6.4b]|uniref:hypothetical protein n=1 Tax=unclassified Paraburkholderia TaxID=2615204 RepID=UPI00161A4C78|nr:MULTISPECIES: hypothetical protein [unclassified Paraburkholderia]MBB5409421.1 hypothetical protein [Paraburkholderia sp. HC6.4b]MBB5451151.1 hypothetical protein [Paraburkholderia sp. Kb1A]